MEYNKIVKDIKRYNLEFTLIVLGGVLTCIL